MWVVGQGVLQLQRQVAQVVVPQVARVDVPEEAGDHGRAAGADREDVQDLLLAPKRLDELSLAAAHWAAARARRRSCTPGPLPV